VSLDKISNKKNYFENDESFQFYIVNIQSHYIQVYIKKRMIRFKLMIFELEKRDLEMI